MALEIMCSFACMCVSMCVCMYVHIYVCITYIKHQPSIPYSSPNFEKIFAILACMGIIKCNKKCC